MKPYNKNLDSSVLRRTNCRGSAFAKLKKRRNVTNRLRSTNSLAERRILKNKLRGDRYNLLLQCEIYLQNSLNFERSGCPERLMYFSNESWINFLDEPTEIMKRTFVSKFSSVEVQISGRSYLIDFRRMLQTDLKAGNMRSIAWIDVNGNCFFPKMFVRGDDHDLNSSSSNLQLNIDICIGDRKTSMEKIESEAQSETKAVDITHQNEVTNRGSRVYDARDVKAVNYNLISLNNDKAANDSFPTIHVDLKPCFSSSRNENKSVDGLNYIKDKCTSLKRFSDCRRIKKEEGEEEVKALCISNSPNLDLVDEKVSRDRKYGFDNMGTKLRKLEEYERSTIMKNLLLGDGLRHADLRSEFVTIYKCLHSGPMGEARMHCFETNLNMTTIIRGNANVQMAWYGASAEIIQSILLHGFGSVIPRGDLGIYGTGVYLSPDFLSELCISNLEPDEEGNYHMLQCRVIMGNSERVEKGSSQSHPSSDKFDSGVDNLANPKLYIVWSTHMGTHILPEYLVRVKLSKEFLERRKQFVGHSVLENNKEGALDNVRLPHLGPPSEKVLYAQNFFSLREQKQQNEGASTNVGVPCNKSFVDLFSAIRGKLPQSTLDSCWSMQRAFKAGNISKDSFIKQIRSTVGDRLLLEAIQILHKKKPCEK